VRAPRLVLALVVVLAGCTTQLAGCTTQLPGTPTTSGAAPQLSCARPATAAIVSCLRASLSEYWRQVLGRRVAAPVVLAPAAAQVPRHCRGALARATAFTCPVDGRVYLSEPYVRRLRTVPPASGAWYRFAATLAHEMGHVVQFSEREPLVENDHPSAADSRAAEQQADCLSGLWAHAVGIPNRRFRAAVAQVLRIVDSPLEQRTHGTPAARVKAVARGQNGTDPRACGLAG
jgi:uncharacterized protein